MPTSVDIEKGRRSVRESNARASFRQRSRSFHEPRTFPPAMPHLAFTGNGNVQMPWVLKRSYTDNGRLVIREVKVRNHDFFRVSRNHGRLTLHRMHLDESVVSPTPACHDPTKASELEEEEKENSTTDKEDKRVRVSSLRPAPLPKREKHKPLLANPKTHQEMNKRKESFVELKRMEQRLFRLPISSSSSALSSLAASSTTTTTTTTKTSKEKTDAVANLLRQGDYRRLSDVSRVSSLPSIASSMPELLLGKGGKGGGGGWLTDKISDSNSPLQVPIPAIGPVHG